MLFLLLGFSLCEATTLCLKSIDGSSCPEGLAATSIVADEDALIAKIVAGSTYNIFTDKALTKLIQTHLSLIVELTGIIDGLEAKASISAAATYESIVLTKITLEIAAVVPGGAKTLDEPAPPMKITYNQMTLNADGKIKAASLVVVNTLQCTSIKDAAAVLTFMADRGANYIIKGDDVISKVAVASGASTSIDLSKNTDKLTMSGEEMKATVISNIIDTTEFTFSGDCSAIAPTVEISLVYGNAKKSVVNIKEESASAFVRSTKLTVKVDTYYTKDTSLKADAIATCKFGEGFLVGADDTRTVPTTPEYCLYSTNVRDVLCPENATLLWDAKELANTKNGANHVTIFLSGYDTAGSGLKLALKDYFDRAIGFSGLAKDKQQIIDFTCEKKDESVTGNQQFNSISVTVTVPKDSADASLSFKNLFITNSKVSAKEADPVPVPPATGSRRLTEDLTIKVDSEDLTSDAASFTAFKAQKPSKSFSVVNPKTLDFAGDGETVKIDSVDFTKDSIPVPFNIVALPGQDLKDVTLKIEENSGSPGKALPFAFDLKEGSNLSVKYSGDWSSNTIVVNVAAGSSFAGNKASDKDKSPVMEKQGSGTATLDDKVLVVASPSASPKGGLGGGAIAGIVIACVVVVAAVGVAVFFVIKKKAKVAN